MFFLHSFYLRDLSVPSPSLNSFFFLFCRPLFSLLPHHLCILSLSTSRRLFSPFSFVTLLPLHILFPFIHIFLPSYISLLLVFSQVLPSSFYAVCTPQYHVILGYSFLFLFLRLYKNYLLPYLMVYPIL